MSTEELKAKRRAEQIENLTGCGLVLLVGAFIVCPLASCLTAVYIVAEAAVRIAGG